MRRQQHVHVHVPGHRFGRRGRRLRAVSGRRRPPSPAAPAPTLVDCSGLVQAAFKSVGVDLPRVSQSQSTAGTQVGSEQPPDIALGCAGSAYHVGVYVGDGMFVGAQNSSTGVVKASLDYYLPSGGARALGRNPRAHTRTWPGGAWVRLTQGRSRSGAVAPAAPFGHGSWTGRNPTWPVHEPKERTSCPVCSYRAARTPPTPRSAPEARRGSVRRATETGEEVRTSCDGTSSSGPTSPRSSTTCSARCTFLTAAGWRRIRWAPICACSCTTAPDDDGVRHVRAHRQSCAGALDPGPHGGCSTRVRDACLVPGAVMAVPRPDRAVAEASDKEGEPLVVEGTGYFAALPRPRDRPRGWGYCLPGPAFPRAPQGGAAGSRRPGARKILTRRGPPTPGPSNSTGTPAAPSPGPGADRSR